MRSPRSLGSRRRPPTAWSGLAWTLQARLPRIGAALDAGIIDYVKARVIAAETPCRTTRTSRRPKS